jgi:RNA polymerase sigma factor (sigma-70 family)
MIIPAIGKQKILYKDHNDIKFESLDFYVNLAQKIIAKLAPTFFIGLSKEMLTNEDAISFVANAIMMGDWRWKQNDSDNTKQYKNLYSYRNQCAIWAIQTYITKKYKHSKNNKCYTMSLLSNKNEDLEIINLIEDTNQTEPIEILIDSENKNIASKLIDDLFSSDILSEKQKQHLRMYYLENQTLENIGKQFNVTREAIRQSIKSAIEKIRKLS